MEPFLRKFFPDVYRRMTGSTRASNYCKFDSQLLTAFTSSLYIAGLVTTLLASHVTSTRGRRASMLLGGAAFLAGACVGGASLSIGMAILGRALLGVGLGFANQAVPLYLSEMAPARRRGAFSNGFQLSVGVGALAANLVNFGTQKIRGGWGWRVSLALAAVPAALLTLGAFFLPETPSSLVQQGKSRHEIAQLLHKIRGADVDVSDELDDIVAAANANNNNNNSNGGLRMLLTQRQYRPQLVMTVMIPFFQQVTGINVAIGAIMAAELHDDGSGLSKGWAGALILLIAVYVAGFGWSWGPLGWLVPSEVFPLEVRAAGQSVTVAVSFAFTVFVAQAFLAMLCRMKAGIFFFFAGWLAVMTAFVYLLLPETKGVPIEQVADVWRDHWFWRRVVVKPDDQGGKL
ncbi:hypothetical protein PR202_ga18210 [Eleusine coracana subsp. coracana]|uniref:Major facilitator superfamily (MFS) profile domain-containing protein n=1 Tax=Eleusine coracana subsp. coracana TaxID=191504 RepID=A0AAV5CSS7_ELECO|nr:hypothetical protein PR202_ga18210 [Eleusine coracana subsp. coracana]